MSNKFHKDLVLDDIHAIVARDYADITTRDADTDFQVAANLDKAVAIQSPASIYLLTSVGPTVWLELTSTGTNTLAGILAGGNITGGSNLIVDSGDDLLVDGGMNVGGVGAPAAEASIDLTATNKALFLNRLTTTQRDLIAPVAGMFIYNSTLNIAQFYNGTVWSAISGGDVFGPVSSTDNAIPRFDGTGGKTLQDSNVLIDDNGLMTIASQLASRHSTTVVEIFSMSDFPAPSAGVITLPSGKYSVRKSVSTSDRFEIGSGSNVEIQIEDVSVTLTYTGTGTMFTSVNPQRIGFNNARLIMTGNGAQLFDIVGGNFIVLDSVAISTGSGTTIGTLVGTGIVGVTFVLFQGFTNGITLTDTNNIGFSSTNIIGDKLGTGPILTILGSVDTSVNIDGVSIDLGASESLFFLDPILVSDINITNTINAGVGEFFQTGTTGPIASFTDVATGTTAATVTDNSGAALFNDTGHGLVVGETVVHTTFTEASYNGTFVVTTVADANTYEVGQAFVSTDSGLFETTTTQVNDVGHGLSNGQTLSIFGTVDFGGGYKIFNVQTDTFEITLGKVFPGSETTGNWDTGSLDQESKFILAKFNGDSEDSHSIADVVIGGNAVATVINTQNIFVDLNLNNSAQASSVTSRFTLTDPDTGEVRYDGLHTETFVVRGLVAASSSGGGQRFNFRLLQNGSDLPSPDDVNIPINIGSSLNSSPIDWPIVAAPGDLFRIQVENADGTSDVTIDTLKFSIA